MTERPAVSPSEKRAARDAAKKGHQVRTRAIQQAMRSGWAGDEAGESNWLDEAASAYPGPEVAVRTLYGLSSRLVERLAEATGEDREQLLRQALK